MTEAGDGAATPEGRCPWCSSAVPDDAERCPTFGAALRDASPPGAEEIPGLTQVDPVLGMRRQLPRPNRLVGWLADIDAEPAPRIDVSPAAASAGAAALAGADPSSVAPPSEEVRREMRRLELEALRAELEERAAEARQANPDEAAAAAGIPDAAAPEAGPGDEAAGDADAEDGAAG